MKTSTKKESGTIPGTSCHSTRREFVRLTGGMMLAGLVPKATFARSGIEVPDICVYGATASGIMSAVAAAREGCSVIMIEPSRWLGGMTGGGLDRIDWGNEAAVGGTTRLVLNRRLDNPGYRAAFAGMLGEHGIPVIFEHRVSSVQREGPAIRSITIEHAPPDGTGCPAAKATDATSRQITALQFIDCSYEGDLMARAGISHTFGREARDTYGESLAGTQENMAVYDLDPYMNPGDPKSGLLPLLSDVKIGSEGAADKLVMGYGFRWKLSKEADRLPITTPGDYDPRTFELYRRAFLNNVDIFRGRQQKYKIGNWQQCGGGFYHTGDCNLQRALWAPIAYGSNADYPEGDYAARSRIWKSQQEFMGGITRFLRTDPSVPKKWRDEAMAFGFQSGIFDDTGGWPHQLYVREARRMISSYVLTQKDLAGETDPDDSVGLASYGVDEWPYAAYPLDGKVALQGGYFSEVRLDELHQGIYKIPYRAIVPAKGECANLLVPVCCSASHIAMTSLRMEPVWMILGESAGVAAAMASKARLAIQDIDRAKLRARLTAIGQRLDRPTPVERHST